MNEKFESPNKPKDQILEVAETSEVEHEAEERFFERDIKTEAELDSVISEVFEEICGEFGRREFFEFTVPAVKKVYGANMRKAGLRLLEIIEVGSDKRPQEIGEYFKTAVSNRELAYAQESKPEILAELKRAIENCITTVNAEHENPEVGVRAVIIYGSFARGDFHYKSDLDLILIVGSEKDRGLNIDGDEIAYRQEFLDRLNQKIRPIAENTAGVFVMDDGKEKFKKDLADQGLVDVFQDHTVVCPDPVMQRYIESWFV